MKYTNIFFSLLLLTAILPLHTLTLKAESTAEKEVKGLLKQKSESHKKKKQKKISSKEIKEILSTSHKSYTEILKEIATSTEFIAVCLSAAFCASVYCLYKSMSEPTQLTKEYQKNFIERIKMEIINPDDPLSFQNNVKLLPLSTGKALCAASDIEQASVLDKYFQTGANPNENIQVGNDSINLAANAAHYGFVESFKTALNHGYKVSSDLLFDICDPIYEENQITKKSFLNKDLQILKLALEQNPNLEARDHWGQTLLHRVKDARAQALLIAAGANTDATDNFGNKPQLTLTNRCNLRRQKMQHQLFEKLQSYYTR